MVLLTRMGVSTKFVVRFFADTRIANPVDRFRKASVACISLIWILVCFVPKTFTDFIII